MAIANSPPSSGQFPGSQPLPGQSTQIQLHDIHVPEQVSNFPIAPGWWILLVLIIISSVWFYKKSKQNSYLNASKNQALATLADNQLLSSKECIILLKWAAMQYCSRQHLAKLYGEDFKDFLMMQLPEKYQEKFNTLITPAFEGQYQAEQDVAVSNDKDCQQAAKLWLTHALPIEKPITIKKMIPLEKNRELSA